jgi:AraC-like DNA-binding protein
MVVIYIFFMTSHQNNFARYLPVNEEALRWEIYCNDAGYTHVQPGTVYPPNPGEHPHYYSSMVAQGRILREFQVVYVTSGSGWFKDKINGEKKIMAGDIFILFPGVWHSYHPDPETGWQEYWVGFSGEHANRLHANKLLDSQKPIYRIGLNEEIIGDYEQIVQLCRDQTPGFQIRLGALVLQLLAHVHTAEAGSHVTSTDSQLINTARSLMNLHLDTGIEIEQIADEIGAEYTHLLDIFRQYTGLTPYQYFLQLRIHRAKQLLSDPALSIKTVSAMMNFENQYYFSRVFKRKTGYSPSEWKAGIIAEKDIPPEMFAQD